MAFNVIGKTVMKSLFSKPATAMYPAVRNDFYPLTRGAIEMNPADCIFCNLCAKRCPTEAIEVSRPERVWTINRARCLVCNFCVDVCPKDCLSTVRQYTAPATDKTSYIEKIIGPPAPAKPE
ncbi:MAG: 4Fe-4S binding protein [Gracilibacteraceae bacterium]|nr:4Fe-4S binding protein [Gracilibacteraceae bacterium]